MGKSYNRNQDKYNKYDRERQQRKGNKQRNRGEFSSKKHLRQDQYADNVFEA